jgi:hypothetical protein
MRVKTGFVHVKCATRLSPVPVGPHWGRGLNNATCHSFTNFAFSSDQTLKVQLSVADLNVACGLIDSH